MRTFFLISILALFTIFSASCNKGDDANADLANQQTEGTKYTDAQTALADGNRFFEENLTEKAIDAYRQAAKLDPDLGEAHFKLGISYALIESEQELIETPEVPVEPGSEPKKEKKNNSIIAFENAVTAYKKAISNDSDNDDAHFNLGRVYDRLNKDQDARKSLEQAVKLKPEDGQYQAELGSILIKLAQYDQAVRTLRKAVEMDEGNARVADLLEQAEAGKKRVDFGADDIKNKLKAKDAANANTAVDTDDPSKGDSKDSNKKPADKKESDSKKVAPKAPAVQPKTPAPGNRE